MSFSIETMLTYSQAKTTTTTKRNKMGAVGVTPDGRRFHYAYANGTLTVGDLVMTAPIEKLAIASNDPGMDTQDITSTWRTIRLSATASTEVAGTVVAKDEYADGWLLVENSTMSGVAGQLVRIKSNTLASDTSSTGTAYFTDVTFADDDSLLGGLDTDGTVQLIPNEYYKVVTYSPVTTLVGKILGVAPVSVTTGCYFWLQTWGACVARVQDTAILGEMLVPNELTTGATGGFAPVDGSTGTTSSLVQMWRGILGYQLGASSGSGDYHLIFLTISP
jgi:hypothetical protein